MSIKLTKTIGNKRVEMDLISLGGKSVVRSSNFKELKKNGLTLGQLKKAGFGVEETK